MRQIITILFLFATSYAYSQQTDTTTRKNKGTANRVTFIAVFHENQATKDGYYIGNYIVEISDEQARQLDGKKIKVTGKLYIVKGLDSQPREYDKNGDLIIKQGRKEDTKHISSPTIEIIEK